MNQISHILITICLRCLEARGRTSIEDYCMQNRNMCSAELFHNHLDGSSAYNSQNRFPTLSLSHNNDQPRRASLLPLWQQKQQ